MSPLFKILQTFSFRSTEQNVIKRKSFNDTEMDLKSCKSSQVIFIFVDKHIYNTRNEPHLICDHIL